RLLEKLTVKPDLSVKKDMEELVDRLRESIDGAMMEPMAGSVDRQPPGFHVSVTFTDPQLAQQICTEITSMFMEQNATRRIGQANITKEFLTQEVNDAKAKLDAQ